MKLEQTKTAFLLLLIILNLVLTWNMWSYQPKYAKLETQKVIQEDLIQEKVPTETFFRPNLIVHHFNSEHFEALDEAYIAAILQNFYSWKYTSLKDISDNFSEKSVLHELMKDGNVEFIFSGKIPLAQYQKNLGFPEKANINMSFDRIIIQTATKPSSVLFISVEKQQVIEAKTDEPSIESFVQGLQNNPVFKKCTAIESGKNNIFYSPEELTFSQTSYYRNSLRLESFEKLLFNDSGFIKREKNSTNETLTDGASLLRIFPETMTFSYVKPTLGPSEILLEDFQIEKSIDFVNSHGGWDRRYRYIKTDETTDFRLFVDGLPVFNDNSISESEIKVQVGKEGIKAYMRPYYALDFQLPNDNQQIELKPGIEIINQLQQKENFDIEKIENLVIGYQMETVKEQYNVIILTPKWYYLYEDEWKRAD